MRDVAEYKGSSAPTMSSGAFERRLGALFHIERAPTLITSGFRASNLAVTEIWASDPVVEVTDTLPVEDAYMLCVQVADVIDHEIWENGRALPRRTIKAGALTPRDLKRSQAALVDQPHHTLFFYLPRIALDELALDAGARPIDEISYEPGVPVMDPIVTSLSACLRPALASPEQASRPFVEHILRALAVHVVTIYGGMAPRSKPGNGGLARWQEKRAKEMLAADLGGGTSLADIALECGLSVGQFSRSFRRSTGLPPHRWLIQLRVEAAKRFVEDPSIPLTKVALSCGFSDQSHLTRVFARYTGLTPAAWRRAS